MSENQPSTRSSGLILLQLISSLLNASVSITILVAGIAFPMGLILPILTTSTLTFIYGYAAIRAFSGKDGGDWKSGLLNCGIISSYLGYCMATILPGFGMATALVPLIALGSDAIGGALMLPAIGTNVWAGIKAIPGMYSSINNKVDNFLTQHQIFSTLKIGKGSNLTIQGKIIKYYIYITVIPCAIPPVAAGALIYHIGKGIKDNIQTLRQANITLPVLNTQIDNTNLSGVLNKSTDLSGVLNKSTDLSGVLNTSTDLSQRRCQNTEGKNNIPRQAREKINHHKKTACQTR